MHDGRVFLFISALVLLACGRSSTPAPITPDPSTKQAPIAPPSPAPSPPLLCESPVSCGVWRACAFFEPIGQNRFRATSGSEKGTTYLRSHQCWPADAGPAGCALYCSGPKGTGTCVDGLMSENETCTGAAAPHISEIRCEVRDGECVQAK